MSFFPIRLDSRIHLCSAKQYGHTQKQTDTVCQKDTGANWKWTQWSKMKQFEQ